nr:10611_t:CDS:2 [Entrophospora candida]
MSTNTTTTKLCEFETMDGEHKWKLLLCSGQFVKNILFSYANKINDSELLLHSFVINIDDPKIKEIFNEIKNISLKSDPEPSEMFKTICTTTIEIQDALNKSHTKISTSNEADKFPPDIPLCSEACSFASSQHKNSSRQNSNIWKKMGSRMDFIIQLLGKGKIMGFGGSEVGKFFEGEHGTKWLAESGLKLSKSPRDMLVELNKQVVDTSEKIEIVGFVKGIVYEIPVDIINFHKALDLIGAVWIAKLKILRTIKLTQQPKSNLAVAIRKKETRKQNHY